tara:strand:+ start:72 stop:677 length:606 start_codon:yes stop_codon:yes gene_type:complete
MPAQKKSASKAKKTKATKTAAPAPAPTPAPAPVEETATVAPPSEGGWSDIEAQFADIGARLKQFRDLYTSITADVRVLQKNVQRHLKETARKHKRKKRSDDGKPKRAPSGFAKPALISTELCTFLGKPEGTEMARTEVTKFLTSYIKEHNLQDQANKRRILPDKKLGKLLNPGKGEEVTYFNLQKYMKVHFPKPSSAPASS